MTVAIHPTAIVHPGAQLEAGVAVGPYCVVGDRVRIGRGTVLHNHVTVLSGTTLGRDNVVYPYAVLGAEPQDLKYAGGDTELIIGDRNRIREHATIHRGTEIGGRRTVIGNDCLIMVGVHVAHDCIVEDEAVIANGTMLGGHCLVEFGAGIGGGAGIHHFTTIGALSFVGGMARVNMDVPPFVVSEGSPAEPRKINTTALMRRKWPPEQIERLRSAFRLLFRGEDGAIMREAIAKLRGEAGEHARSPFGRCLGAGGVDPVLRLCDFVERMDMGLHGRYRESLRGSPEDRRGR